MTIPIERSYSIENTREFLTSLIDPKKTPRIPKHVRLAAYWCLRHYPWDMDMEDARKKAPDVFGSNKEWSRGKK